MATLQQFLTGALRLINVGGAGETPSANELADAKTAFVDLVNAWDAEHHAIYTVVNRTEVLDAGVGSYTMGSPGGAIDAPRPAKIESAGIIRPNGLRFPLQLISSPEWAMIPEKTAQGKVPIQVYNDDDYPLININLWPVPIDIVTLDLTVWQEISSDDLALADPLDFPRVYDRAIRYNLAVDLAAEWGKEVPPQVAAIAQASKIALFGLNVSNESATEDAAQ